MKLAPRRYNTVNGEHTVLRVWQAARALNNRQKGAENKENESLENQFNVLVCVARMGVYLR